jgi:hypothetical protein
MLALLTGLLGIVANCIIYQQKKGKNLLLCKLISDVLWFFHYLFLNAYSGSAIALIGVLREFVFYKENQKERKSILFLLFFILVTVFSAILTWKSVISVFPALASVISIISFWKANPTLSRILAFPISVLMLTYDLSCTSYVGIANEILTITATIFAIIYTTHKRKVDEDENRSY